MNTTNCKSLEFTTKNKNSSFNNQLGMRCLVGRNITYGSSDARNQFGLKSWNPNSSNNKAPKG